jgi:hypothetical protein
MAVCSCQNNYSTENSKPSTQKLTEMALSSTALRALNVNTFTLDLDQANSYSKGNENFLTVPYKDNLNRLLTISFDKKDSVILAFEIEAISNKANNSNLENVIRAGQFNGLIVFRTSDNYELSMKFENSLLVDRKAIGKRSLVCGPINCDACNNVASSAGRRLAQKDWVYILTWCSAGFFGCLSQEMYECWRDGCERYYK